MRLKLFAIVTLLVVSGGAIVMAMGGLSPSATAATTPVSYTHLTLPTILLV